MSSESNVEILSRLLSNFSLIHEKCEKSREEITTFSCTCKCECGKEHTAKLTVSRYINMDHKHLVVHAVWNAKGKLLWQKGATMFGETVRLAIYEEQPVIVRHRSKKFSNEVHDVISVTNMLCPCGESSAQVGRFMQKACEFLGLPRTDFTFSVGLKAPTREA